MPTPPKHRDKIIRAAALLFRRVGYNAAGMNDIVALSGAPKGSVYYNFPGGKDEIAQEALAYAGGLVTQTLTELSLQTNSAAVMFARYTELLAHWMAKSDYQDGCPVTTTLLETTNSNPAMATIGNELFAAWQMIFASKLVADGLATDRAARLATLAIASMEGALVLARVQRSGACLKDTGEEVATLFKLAVASRTSK